MKCVIVLLQYTVVVISYFVSDTVNKCYLKCNVLMY